MKKSISLFLLIAMSGVLVGCGEKKKSDVIIAPKPEAPKPKQTQKMSNYEQAREVTWLGNTYKVVMKREADTSLPTVESDDHTKYFDNKIVIRVLRQDGSEFFNRTFTKSDFSSYVDEATRKEGALLGLVFDEVKDDVLVFAGSIGSPDITSDEYVPLVMKINRMGAVSIAKDTRLDTDGNEKAPSKKDEASDEDGV